MTGPAGMVRVAGPGAADPADVSDDAVGLTS